MNLKITNREHFILSISQEQLPEGLHGHTLIFYLSNHDAIVLNEGSPVFKELSEMIGEYLSLSDWQRKACMDELHRYEPDDMICGIMQTVNQIIRIRRRLYKHMAA